MLLAKNFLVLAVLTAGVHNASASNNLRAVERDLYGYDSPYSESVTIQQNTYQEKKPNDKKMKPKYKVYNVSKGMSSEDSSFEDSAPSRGGTKKKTATIITRKPRPYKRPSNWIGDGHSKPPTLRPVEPVVTPQPDWKDDGFEPVVTPVPTE